MAGQSRGRKSAVSGRVGTEETRAERGSVPRALFGCGWFFSGFDLLPEVGIPPRVDFASRQAV